MPLNFNTRRLVVEYSIEQSRVRSSDHAPLSTHLHALLRRSCLQLCEREKVDEFMLHLQIAFFNVESAGIE